MYHTHFIFIIIIFIIIFFNNIMRKYRIQD